MQSFRLHISEKAMMSFPEKYLEKIQKDIIGEKIEGEKLM